MTKPSHPLSLEDHKNSGGCFPTNGQVERMNRTIKEATVKRFHYDSHDQLRTLFTDLTAADNFDRRHKTLGGLTPYEYVCNIWTSEPYTFILTRSNRYPE